MERARLRWAKVWKDESEGFYNIEVSASNGRFASTVDIYCYPEEIANFGQQLLNFPQTLQQEVVFENGEDMNLATVIFFSEPMFMTSLGMLPSK
jgi:hypothetical protein